MKQTKQTELSREEFLASMKLPQDTSEKELAVILQANIGTNLPLTQHVYLALLELAMTDQGLAQKEAREYLAKKFPSIPAPVINPPATTTAELLESMGLPAGTTTKEFHVICQANGGQHLPFHPGVYKALLRLAMVDQKLPEDEARQYLATKFPGIKPALAGQSTDGAAAELREQLIKIYDLPATATEADIAAAAAAAKDSILAEKAQRAQEAADEAVIHQKVSMGLTREQAVNVIRRQREHDAELKRGRDQRRPRLVEIIRALPELTRETLKKAHRQVRDHYPFIDSGEVNDVILEEQGRRQS